VRKGYPTPATRPTGPNWAKVEPVPRNRLVPGTVVWAHIGFRDGTGEKARPAVVVEVRGREVVLLPGTTSEKRHRLRDHVEVLDLDEAGLDRPTGVSTIPVVVDRRIDLTSIAGELSEQDHDRVFSNAATLSRSGVSVAA
jgi:hypothetical protein